MRQLKIIIDKFSILTNICRFDITTLRSLFCLEELNLSNNLIANMDSIRLLRHLTKLKKLLIADNPICNSRLLYPQAIFIALPSLIYLDEFHRDDLDASNSSMHDELSSQASLQDSYDNNNHTTPHDPDVQTVPLHHGNHRYGDRYEEASDRHDRNHYEDIIASLEEKVLLDYFICMVPIMYTMCSLTHINSMYFTIYDYMRNCLTN